jgi:predicted nucleic acid-binding protein
VVLIDTDVLIDYLREREEAVAFLNNIVDEIAISAITVAELYAGVREGTEREKLDTFISAFEVIMVDGAVAVQGGLYRRDFFRSHGVGLADALIAASTVSYGATLVTLNEKHFPMLDSVSVPYRKQ